MDLTPALALAGVGVGVVVGLITIWAFIRPGVRRGAAVADAILGEEALLDRGGSLIQPAKPGLVHRVATVEDAVVEFKHALGIYTEVLGRVDKVERVVAELQTREVKDIIAAAERAATAAASAEMLRMVRDRDDLIIEDES